MIEKESRNKPGPGAYNTTYSNLRTNPQYKIGTSKRDNGHNKSQMSASPGTYDPNDSFSKTMMPSIGFGSSKR